MSAGGVLGKAMEGFGLEAGDMWRHSIAVAVTAGEIAAAMASDALDSVYMAGLLHDVGKIILDPYVRERKVLFNHYHANYPEKSLQDAERDILGFDHAVIAAILCESWNLPRAISFGIRHHHQPSAAGDHQLSHIVHLADYFTVQAGVDGGGKASCQEMDSNSRTLVPLDVDTLRTTAEKAGKYVESLTGRLLGA
jgi:putative nucleotidyltransferase with HDIG domain